MSPCQTFLHTLRTRGYRITSQRELIVEAIAHGSDHLNAEQVYSKIRKKEPSINIATVYRTLDLLVEQGLASRIYLTDGRIFYAAYQHGPHLHLVCRQCGKVTDANHELLLQLNQQLNKNYQFTADLQHIAVPGLCNQCKGNPIGKR